ncbi:hypothetical protein PENTCL1PPCAC_18386, partial [Pristionchus entomophagus]
RMASCVVKKEEDWLMTPGIAHTSIKQLNAMGRDLRERRAVMLSFNDTERDKNIKRNHARHMNNLKDRYQEIQKGKESEEVKEDEEMKMDGEEEKEKKDAPCFGTISGFCDKRITLVTETNASLSKPLLMPNHSAWLNRQGYNKPDYYPKNQSRGKSNRTKNPETDDSKQLQPQQQVQQRNGNHINPKQAEIDNAQQQPQQSQQEQSEQQWWNGETLTTPRDTATDSPNKNMLWNTDTDKFSGFGVYIDPPLSVVIEKLHQVPSSMTTPNYSTPTESRLQSMETSPVLQRMIRGEAIPIPTCLISPTPAPPVPKSGRVSFEKVQGTSGCPNPTVEEKVRRWDKEPTAAGKRYTKPLDRVQNSGHHQLQTQIKFDKRRVKRWVEKSNCSEEDLKVRRRRNSDPCEDVYPVKDLVVPEEEPAMDEEMEKAKEVFVKMHGWMENVANGGMQWALEEAGRVDTPSKNDLVVVRVVEARGRRGTIVPASAFTAIEATLQNHVQARHLPSCSPDLHHEMIVIVDQEGDMDGVSEYRRGWVFDKGDKEGEVKVLLMDERRIVSHPLSSLAPYPAMMEWGAPLCISAIFDRKVLDRERDLMIYGCTAQCRVMGGGENGDPLKLRLVKINSEGVTLDELFCCEECAGACEHHRDHPRDS